MVSIRIEGVEFSYPSRPALRGVTVEIPPRSFTAVLGPNGAGKSTLMKIMASVLKPRRGAVYFDGRIPRREELYKMVGYVPQRATPGGRLRVIDLVVSSRKPYFRFFPTARDYKAAEEALKRVGVSHLRDRFLEELSGGEFQLVLLARALAVEPRVLLLDEPFNNLDLRHQLEVASLLRKLSSDVTVVAVLHDLNMALRYADYAIFMSRGEVYAAGPTKAVFREDVIYDVYGVKTKILWEIPAVIPQQPPG
ncbi:ABC transporter related protein [Pyrobaculum islandicum DSM 4184]|uniref:ABC transporter related protein n=1 Tax=Pyrobaculum islandicum (strain DSM 4184 / JCM 9189 / GEO3) TaxID=384616 RepID=A1RR14_PYRIL|nr:ABC transporter ATP-binding protein [Pyrobaculum islandicum]ABL87396.1 ABC transporter related protein [Pyrobaculum islandicum DSM 4184]